MFVRSQKRRLVGKGFFCGMNVTGIDSPKLWARSPRQLEIFPFPPYPSLLPRTRVSSLKRNFVVAEGRSPPMFFEMRGCLNCVW